MSFQVYKQGHGGTGKTEDAKTIANAFEMPLIIKMIGNNDSIRAELDDPATRFIDANEPLPTKIGGLNYSLGLFPHTNPLVYYEEAGEGLQSSWFKSLIKDAFDPGKRSRHIPYFQIDLDTSRQTKMSSGNPELRKVVPYETLQRFQIEKYDETPKAKREQILSTKAGAMKAGKPSYPPELQERLVNVLTELEPVILAVNEACQEQSYRPIQRCAENISALTKSDFQYNISYEKERYVEQILRYYETLHPTVRKLYGQGAPVKVRGSRTKELLNQLEVSIATDFSKKNPLASARWDQFCKLPPERQRLSIQLPLPTGDKSAEDDRKLLEGVPKDLISLRVRALDLDSSHENSSEE